MIFKIASRQVARCVMFAAIILSPNLATAFEPQRLTAAMDEVRKRDYTAALAQAERAGDSVVVDIVNWHRLRAGQGSWSEFAQFLSRNADWPGLPLMRRRAEAKMPADLSRTDALAFFAQGLPQTGRGALIYAAALTGEDRTAELRRAWTTLEMSSSDRAAFLASAGATVAGQHADRLEMLLWERETEVAAEMLDKVPAAEAAVARARIALQDEANGVDALITAVPASHAGDPGLAHDRFRWRLGKGRWDSAAELLKERSTSAAALGRPEAWASNRRSIARREMRNGRARSAYTVASQHFLSGGSNYADLEWLSGYLALTYLDDPRRAAQHFENFRQAVATPISLGRAGYWLGRALEAMGEQTKAQQAYAYGAQYQTSFYGQLATEKAGLTPDTSIAARGTLPSAATSGVLGSGPLTAALRLTQVGEDILAIRFLLHIQESLSHQQSAALAAYALDIDQTSTAVRIAKRIVRGGPVYPDAYYPVTELAEQARVVPAELAMSIARQESELNPRAISPAGARGLMQLMPGTAQKVSGELGIEYSRGKLTADPAYNARLGTQYLADMLKRYDGSVILAAAAYNAGPGRADRWIELYGDPRAPGADVIRWIENIPFRETRNYVMRVAESLHVYRTRITGRAGPIQLSQTLRNGL